MWCAWVWSWSRDIEGALVCQGLLCHGGGITVQCKLWGLRNLLSSQSVYLFLLLPILSGQCSYIERRTALSFHLPYSLYFQIRYEEIKFSAADILFDSVDRNGIRLVSLLQKGIPRNLTTGRRNSCRGEEQNLLHIFIFAPCINSLRNTFYCSNWCTLL